MIPKQPDPIGEDRQSGQDAWAEPSAGQLVEWLNEFDDKHAQVDDMPVDEELTQMTDVIRQRLQANPLPDADRFLSLLEHLDQALAWLSGAARIASDAAADPGALFDTIELHRSIVDIFDHTQVNSMLLEQVMLIAAENRPLAVTFPSGERWGGKMTLRQVARLYENVKADGPTTTYLRGHANANLAEATGTKCSGGPTKKPCNGVRVRRADGTRAASCWAHLTKTEKTEIRAEREAAMAQPCSLCHARPGEPCVDDQGVETTIHNYRLRPDTARRQQ